MQIVMENLHSGIKTELTHEGININPRFSESGDYVYFLSRPYEGSKIQKNQLSVYSLKNMKIVKSVTPYIDNITLTTSILPGNKILCYREDEDHENICIYSTDDGKITQLTDDVNKKSDALISPDGKWISYIEEDIKSSRKNICIITSKGDKKIYISQSSGIFSDVKYYTWTNDSKSIGYIEFLTLIVKSVDGLKTEKADLTGLTNFKCILPEPLNPDSYIIVARQAGTDLSFSILIVSVKEDNFKPWKEKRSFWEIFYSISPDGSRIVYSDKR